MNPFGANWKPAVSGYLTTICAIAIALATLPAEIWQNPKVWISSVILIIAKTIQDSLTKDKNNTGGSKMQTIDGNYAREGTQSLVDLTVKASIASDEKVTPLQEKLANS